MKFPGVRQVYKSISAAYNEVTGGEGDVRLQVCDDGGWALHYGDSSYDQDHRGFWGASCLPARRRPGFLRHVAEDLLEQVKDAYAQSVERWLVVYETTRLAPRAGSPTVHPYTRTHHVHVTAGSHYEAQRRVLQYSLRRNQGTARVISCLPARSAPTMPPTEAFAQ